MVSFVCVCGALWSPVASANDGSGVESCVEVAEYAGINALPAVTMQIHPAAGGDTVVNDAEYPPGPDPKVVVGFWEHARTGYTPAPGENPCAGEPTFKIAYPLAYGWRTCYGWKHWLRGNELHPNSAMEFRCEGEVFFYRQWTTMTCEGNKELPFGILKEASPTRCCQDQPQTLWSQLLSGCGKEPPVPPR